MISPSLVGISVGTNGILVCEHADGYLPCLLSQSRTTNSWTHIAVVYTNNRVCAQLILSPHSSAAVAVCEWSFRQDRLAKHKNCLFSTKNIWALCLRLLCRVHG
jgi:hypothetical protein